MKKETKILKKFSELSVAIVDEKKMVILNKQYKKHNYTGLNFDGLKMEMITHDKLKNFKTLSMLSNNIYTESLLSIDADFANLDKETKEKLINEFSIDYHYVAIYKNKKE